MENSIHQKKKKELEPESAAKALQDLGFRPGVPVDVDSDPGLSEEAATEVAGDKPKNNKKRKTEEEKEGGLRSRTGWSLLLRPRCSPP